MSVTKAKTPEDIYGFAEQMTSPFNRPASATPAADFLAGFETAIAINRARPDVYAEVEAIITGQVNGQPFDGNIDLELSYLGVK